jgi:hypothetical protein
MVFHKAARLHARALHGSTFVCCISLGFWRICQVSIGLHRLPQRAAAITYAHVSSCPPTAQLRQHASRCWLGWLLAGPVTLICKCQ